MVEQLVIATGVMGLLFLMAIVVTSVVLVRGVRRRYRSVRARFLGPDGRPDLSGTLRASGSVAAASLGSPVWWRVQNHRHRLWKAVTSAEHAVGVARRANVATGDLPALARDLHAAATAVDAVLRASGHQGPLREEDRLDCDRIVVAADEIREAALASLRHGSHSDTEMVVSAVRIEVAALAAGLRASHG